MKTFARVVSSIFLVLVGAPSIGSAQATPLESGETVLVNWRDLAFAGTPSAYRRREIEVVSADWRQLVGRRGGRTYLIDRSAITRVRRRIGTLPATAPEIVAGSAIGFGAAFLLGAISSPGDRSDMGLSTGVLVGAPVGALVAWMRSRSRGIYEDVPLSELRVSRESGRARIDLGGRVATP